MDDSSPKRRRLQTEACWAECGCLSCLSATVGDLVWTHACVHRPDLDNARHACGRWAAAFKERICHSLAAWLSATVAPTNFCQQILVHVPLTAN